MRVLLGVLALALAVPATSAAAATAHTSPAGHGQAAAAKPHHRAMPTLHVRKQVKGLSNPWDVQPIGGGRLLITQRDKASLTLFNNGKKHHVKFPSGRVWVSGETGLMSMEIDPGFANSGRFYTCSGWKKQGGGHDVRVNAWKLNDAGTRARFLENIVKGFPTSSGRHGGCRLLILRNGALLVGTGDAATGKNPENLKSLGGKTLLMNRMNGKPWPTNRFVHSQNRKKRYIHTYGHRNIQGLAQRADGTLWNVEHGTFRDDEVNLLKNGGDYGYNPVPNSPGDPSYNEEVPMTDQSLPGKQVKARWRSGFPTLATSGGTFVTGDRWGALSGALAVACLKASRVVFLSFDAGGKLQRVRMPRVLRQFGRIRTVANGLNGDLLVTTDNGGGRDVILRVSPR
jgi:glucose/arabinose dehydrogenase